MELLGIEHIGIAVTDLEEAVRYWEDVMGVPCYGMEEVTDQKVRTAFFRVGEAKIELLEPTDKDSSVARFIEKNKGKGGVHHIAFAVPDTDAALGEMKEKQIQLIDESGRPGAEGMTIGFLHPKSTLGVLTEFCCQTTE